MKTSLLYITISWSVGVALAGLTANDLTFTIPRIAEIIVFSLCVRVFVIVRSSQ